MKLAIFCLLSAGTVFCFYYFLLGLLHLESLLLSGAMLFVIIFFTVCFLTRHRRGKE
ncbi:hypothetical protein NIE88_12875 [Sporolactobacillus shoreicorticis]|uniref:Uncharacterized protein n=1 Tax=Sporolactobacillus shoreicorticis TaxID=1923877 RepID=A0ABW5S5E9_9BACL|nr:hypothetical protein [Sporolactobacillus shoreicorticis]MCO7126658.1 hypothetical protein [Sporolactobacillus shoreicorticis]